MCAAAPTPGPLQSPGTQPGSSQGNSVQSHTHSVPRPSQRCCAYLFAPRCQALTRGYGFRSNGGPRLTGHGTCSRGVPGTTQAKTWQLVLFPPWHVPSKHLGAGRRGGGCGETVSPMLRKHTVSPQSRNQGGDRSSHGPQWLPAVTSGCGGQVRGSGRGGWGIPVGHGGHPIMRAGCGAHQSPEKGLQDGYLGATPRNSESSSGSRTGPQE